MKAATIKLDHINECLGMFNGYWANDYQRCDDVADKYGYDKKLFTSEVYKHVKF